MYEYGYYYETSPADETMGVIVLIMMLAIYGALFLGLIANYVLNALAWYKIAKKEGVNNPFLAWIPVADNLIVGGVSSKIDRLNGKERNWGKLLLILAIVLFAGITVGYVGFVVVVIFGAAFSAANEALGSIIMGAGAVLFYALFFAAALAGQASSYLKGICVYKYVDYAKPEKMFKYMLLYFMVPFAGPICLMKTTKTEEDDYVEIEVPVTEE